MVRSIAFASVLLSSIVSAADPVAPIRLPISAVPVVPSAVTELAADAIFVIEADEPCLVLASRVGFVSVTKEEGPLRIRGRFADGARIETRTYKAEYLWIVEAVAPGEVELLVVPSGAKDASAVLRRTLVVGGVGPRPPPKPDPKPDPVDPPEPPIVDPPIVDPAPVTSKVMTVVIVEKAIERTAQSAALIADLGYWNSLEPIVRTTHIVPAAAELAKQYKKQTDEFGFPCVILLAHPSNKLMYAGKLPIDKVAMSALINKFTAK